MINDDNKNGQSKGTDFIKEGYVPNGHNGEKVENGYSPKPKTQNKTSGSVKGGQKA